MVELMLKNRAVRRFNWLFPLSCQMPEIERKNLRQSCSIASKRFFLQTNNKLRVFDVILFCDPNCSRIISS